MLLLRSFRRHQDRSMLHPVKGSHLHSLSLRARVFHPNTRIDVRLLGPCFKTGRLRPLRQHPSRSAVLGPRRWHFGRGYNTFPKEATFPNLLSHRQNRCWLNPRHNFWTEAQSNTWELNLVSSASLSAISRTF